MPDTRGRVFLGRQDDARRVGELLDTWPVVTITGPGGVGKTALAAHVTRRLDNEFNDAVTWCDLARLPAGRPIGESLAAWLGFPSLEAATAGLDDGNRLIVLDNCEHVIESAAATARRLVDAASGVRVLATSREPLTLDVEHVVVLGPLASNLAVELLRTRADQVGASLHDVGDHTLASLCHNLDNLPLAIELTAARLRVMAPDELDAHLDRRLDLLTGGRLGPDHHRSLRATIARSYDLLDHDERRFFTRMGIFAGFFTLDDARSVCGEDDDREFDVIAILDRLVAQSMVVTTRERSTVRFRLLYTLREFAREQLRASGEMQQIHDRLLDHLHAVARYIVEQAVRTWDAALIDRLFDTADDLYWAVGQCLAMDDEPSRAFALYRPAWGIVHHTHAALFASIGEELLSRWPLGSHAGATDAAVVCATAHLRLGRRDRAEQLARAAMAAADPGLIAPVAGRRLLALIEQHKGALKQALEWADQGLELCDELGLTPFAAELRAHRGLILGQLGRRADAIACARQAHAESAAEDSVLIHPWAASVTGRLLLEEDPIAARHYLDEGLDLHLRLHNRYTADSAGLIRQSLAIAALRTAGAAQAAGWLREALLHFRLVGDQIELWQTLRWTGVWLARNGHVEAARSVLAAARSHPATPAVTRLEEDDLADAIARVGGDGALASAPVSTPTLVVDRAFHLLDASLSAEPRATGPVARTHGAMRREGEVWALRFGDQVCQLRDAKGLHDLYSLLAQPGQEIHCLTLMGAYVEQSDLGPTLDARARRELEDRIRALQEDLDEAEAACDLGRAERSREELDYLVAELGKAFGVGGRDRRVSASAERARSAVTWRLRAAIKRIGKVCPDLGRHLRHAVRTGTFCVYAPETSVEWDLG